MGNFFRGFIRASSFLRKETFEILRQPRLVFTLILGPFLILLVFGIGYRNQARPLRTLFVAPTNSPMANQIQQYATSLGNQLIFSGITGDQNAALDKLRQGEVDLVAVAPANPYETIRNSKQAVFTLYHREIDPFQADYIKYFGEVYTDEVNKRVLRAMAEQGQKDASNLHQDLQAAHQNVTTMRQAIQAGDQVAALQNQQALSTHVDTVALAVGASLGLLSGVQQTTGAGQDVNGSDPSQIQSLLNDLRQNTDQLNTGGSTNQNEELARLDKIDQDISSLDKNLTEFQSINPTVIVSPFISETKSIASVQPSATDFFAPAVLALLLQHLAVTFAALSIVRERSVGTMELFRVSPLSSAEALVGKYVSYMLFGGIIATALSALLVFGLHMPLLGNPWYFALVIAVVIFTSLGIGFVISIISQTDSQAVQYSMIVLLASVFFSGFLMSLDTLIQPVRVISWALPTTYGSILLRDIALRGVDPNWLYLGGLAAIGVGLLILSWLLMRRLISQPE